MEVTSFLMLLWTVALVVYTFFAVRDMIHYVEYDMAENGLKTLSEALDEEEED